MSKRNAGVRICGDNVSAAAMSTKGQCLWARTVGSGGGLFEGGMI